MCIFIILYILNIHAFYLFSEKFAFKFMRIAKKYIYYMLQKLYSISDTCHSTWSDRCLDNDFLADFREFICWRCQLIDFFFMWFRFRMLWWILIFFLIFSIFDLMHFTIIVLWTIRSNVSHLMRVFHLKWYGGNYSLL